MSSRVTPPLDTGEMAKQAGDGSVSHENREFGPECPDNTLRTIPAPPPKKPTILTPESKQPYFRFNWKGSVLTRKSSGKKRHAPGHISKATSLRSSLHRRPSSGARAGAGAGPGRGVPGDATRAARSQRGLPSHPWSVRAWPPTGLPRQRFRIIRKVSLKYFPVANHRQATKRDFTRRRLRPA